MAGKKSNARRGGEDRYTREELTRGAEALFGVKPEVLAGALHGESKTSWTIGEARRSVEQFRKRKVK